MDRDSYVPALRFRSLTSLYDPAIRWTTREAEFKRRLLTQATLRPGQQVLDIGCGTGTLLLAAKEREPQVEAVGLDGDSQMLEQAREKIARTGVAVRLDEGLSFEMPYEDRCFDRVLSTLFFHHLTTADKRRTFEEITRVLKPGGELHVADWGPGTDTLMRTLFWSVRLLDGLEQTRANAAGTLPGLMEAAGLAGASERDRMRTPFGAMVVYRAARPASAAVPDG